MNYTNETGGRLTGTLNPMQEKGVRTLEGPLLLLAGAGSGKTKVLTHRIAHLIESGVDPFNILAITFTNKAAREMKERVESISPRGGQVWVSTFHSFCTRILRREIHRIDYENSFTIYDSDDAERIIRNCIKELDINEKQFPSKAAMTVISGQKDELVTPEEFERSSSGDYRMSRFAQIYKRYQRKLKASNALDFDDIIFKTVELFTLHPQVLDKYQERFHYIMVDEYQDTNTSQYKLVRLLAQKYENLCVVGDDDQSIYAWRGANVRNILDFEKDFPNAATIKLEQNYRSTQSILNAANYVIANNKNRKEKKLWTQNDEGNKIAYYRAPSDTDEGIFVAQTIAKSVEESAGYSNFAVLYRTNAQSRSLEDQLVKSNIPYRLFGGVRFYERMEIKDILAYARAIHNPFDDISYTRIINVPRRGIGSTTIDRILSYAAEHDFAFSVALKELEYIEGVGNRAKRIRDFMVLMDELRSFSETHPVSETLEKILADTDYLSELEREGTEEAQSRIDNVYELIAKAVEYEKQSENPTLGAFLEEVALVADIDNYEEGQETVSLLTLHSAKGLEFPIVFITGFEEGIFPSYRSIMSDDRKALEEERRLCYVGITRAKQQLYLLTAVHRSHHGQTVYNSPSRFLEEIPVDLVENMNEIKKPAVVKAAVKPAAGKYRPRPIDPHIWENIPAPKDVQLDFVVGDSVRQMKYGIGIVREIRPAGADYEVAVEFSNGVVRRFMAHLSKLKKVEA